MKMSPKDNEMFVCMIRVAQADSEVRKRLVAILSLDKSQRDPALHTFRDEMAMRQKPKEFLDALACLLNEDVSARTLEIVRAELDEAPSLNESVWEQLVFGAKLLLSVPAGAAVCWLVNHVVFKGLKSAADLEFAAGIAMIFVGGVIGGTVLVKRSWLVIFALSAAALLAWLLLVR